jgi:hypothetical protein
MGAMERRARNWQPSQGADALGQPARTSRSRRAARADPASKRAAAAGGGAGAQGVHARDTLDRAIKRRAGSTGVKR